MEKAPKQKTIVKAFRAYASGSKYATRTADTPKQAAEAFFAANPSARKCDVTEGEIEYTDGIAFFVTKFRIGGPGARPQAFKEVTKKTVCLLPDTVDGAQKV